MIDYATMRIGKNVIVRGKGCNETRTPIIPKQWTNKRLNEWRKKREPAVVPSYSNPIIAAPANN